MLYFAMKLHCVSHVDSTIKETRIYWREKIGATPSEARDPRPFSEVVAERPRGKEGN